ncbi:MAG: M48 family metalloprotease, partial [Pseudomonadota bacterium]|nr:M48 family metalloprotease [Pseudomonadota bacterium]
MAMSQDAFETLVKRLEDKARRHPRAYKFNVLLLALLGYGYLLAILGGCAGLIGLMAAGIATGHGGLLLLAKNLGLPLLILMGVVGRSLWVRLPPPDGIPVARAQAPALFAVLDDVRRRQRGPAIHRVLLTDEFNAGIVQIPRLGLLGWNRNYLLLGLPLLQACGVAQLTAVLAHEYGHLSGAHGRFGAWIYRIRNTWGSLAGRLDREGHWGSGLITGFLNWYAPFFNAYTFVLARANEYQADRAAADTAGSRHLAEALVDFRLKMRLLAERYWPQVYAAADRLPQPSLLPHRDMAAALAQRLAPEDAQTWLDAALAERTGLADTHPALADRLARLDEPPRLADPAPASAAGQLLGDALPALTAALDQTWQQQVRAGWQERYHYVQTSTRRLQDLDERAAAVALTGDEPWERARLVEEFRTPGEALALYEAILQADPRHAGAAFAAGRCRLALSDDAGLACLDRAMELEDEAVLPACQLAWDYLHARDRGAEARRYREIYERQVGIEELA